MKTIDELKTGGYSELEIAEMLDIEVYQVYDHLTNDVPHIPVVVSGDMEQKEGTEALKDDIVNAASFAVKKLRSNMNKADATELSKLTDSIAKLYTALFKEDKGTQITIHQNNLSMFKNSLKH